MNEAAARRLSLACALEAADAHAALIPHEERKRFTQAAIADTGIAPSANPPRAKSPLTVTEEAYLIRRGEMTLAAVSKKHPHLVKAANGLRWSGWLSPALILAALLFGALAVEASVLKRMNILAYPLMGLIAWNVAVMLSLPLRWLTRVALRRPPRPAIRALIGSAVPARVDGWLRGDRNSEAATALAHHATGWVERSLPLNAARAARLLHWSAIALALGAIAGLYLRGIVFQFTAGWESTFLTPSHVHEILKLVLTPASRITGIQIPGVEAMSALRFGADNPGENASRWIHLYAVTTALFVIVPRLIFATLAHLRVVRLHDRFPWPTRQDPRIRRWLSAATGHKERVLVVPLGYTPGTEVARAIQAAAAYGIGEQAEVQVLPPVTYGDDAEGEQDNAGDKFNASAIIVLLSLNSTPEREVHVAAIQRLNERLHQRPESSSFTVLIDESPMRQRLEGQPELVRRLEERRNAWRDAMSACTIDIYFEDLAAAEAAERTRRLGSAIASHSSANEAQ